MTFYRSVTNSLHPCGLPEGIQGGKSANKVNRNKRICINKISLIPMGPSGITLRWKSLLVWLCCSECSISNLLYTETFEGRESYCLAPVQLSLLCSFMHQKEGIVYLKKADLPYYHTVKEPCNKLLQQSNWRLIDTLLSPSFLSCLSFALFLDFILHSTLAPQEDMWTQLKEET